MSKVIVHVQRNIHEKVRKGQLNKIDEIINSDNNNNSNQLSKKQNDQINKVQQNDNKKIQTARYQQKVFEQDVLEQKGKTIRQIQQFFQQRYLGPKKNTKIANFNKLSKTPLFNPQISSAIFKMKTPNLNIKLKQIQKIFNVEKKSNILKKKKLLVESQNLSQFQLYLTKRDVLKQKNQSLQEMRKFWLEQKQKQQEKKLKKKLSRNSKKDEQHVQNNNENQEYKVNEQQLTNQQTNKEQKPISTQRIESTKPKNKSISLYSQLNNDQYFQKKFQQKIVKNSLSTQQKFSIRSMLQPSRNKKTTINSLQYFQSQLDVIENVARNTIDHFHHRQIVNKILYSQVTQSQEDYKTVLMSKRGTPIIKQGSQKGSKSIGWVLKQCQNFKKRFNIRKTKSLSNIKRNNT